MDERGVTHDPGMEQVPNCFTLLSLENQVNHFCVVLGVGKHGYGVDVLRIEVTETNFQRSEEKTLPIFKTLTVLAYHRTPIICDLRQAHGAGFQLDQVVQCMRDNLTLGLGDSDG